MPNGEVFLQQFQAGVETAYGTAVAATRKMYFRPDSKLMRERAPRPHRFATGSRDNVRAFTLGPEMVAGSVSQELSPSELIELLLITIKGAVTPSTVDTSARLWAFTPGNTLDSMTLQQDDGAIARRAAGVYGNSLKIAGSAHGDNIVTCDLFGKALTTNALTGSLTARVPDFFEGYETKLYVDAYGGTPGTTNIAGTLINWDVTINNNLGRKFTADNVNTMNKAIVGEIGVEATLTFEAVASQSATEFTNWDAATKRLVRLEFGNNTLVGAVTAKSFVTVDIPGAWSAFGLGGSDDGTRTYELKLQYVYDTTNAYGLQIRAQNARATAW